MEKKNVSFFFRTRQIYALYACINTPRVSGGSTCIEAYKNDIKFIREYFRCIHASFQIKQTVWVTDEVVCNVVRYGRARV
jgi:hypothetical protein